MDGIYLHIPFCLRKCPYCDFYSVRMERDLRRQYVQALKNQILSFPAVSADTVYFGGGTPSLLEPEEMEELLEQIRSHHRLAPDAEISMECNPATADLARLSGFRAAGVNRLSVGCQSFSDPILQGLGRLHGSAQAIETVQLAREAGFSNISVDLMLAVPHQTPELAAADAAAAAKLGVEHVSAYLLKICEGTPFAAGVPGLPDDDTAAACYEALCSVLEQEGYAGYEISNFAKPGFESRHNLKYWRCGRWLGLGPAAHLSDGRRRYSTAPDLHAFLAAYAAGPVPDPLSLMRPEGEVDAEEYLITSLRTAEGLSFSRLREEFGTELDERQSAFLKQLISAGLAAPTGEGFRLTRSGWLVSNSILSELI